MLGFWGFLVFGFKGLRCQGLGAWAKGLRSRCAWEVKVRLYRDLGSNRATLLPFSFSRIPSKPRKNRCGSTPLKSEQCGLYSVAISFLATLDFLGRLGYNKRKKALDPKP